MATIQPGSSRKSQPSQVRHQCQANLSLPLDWAVVIVLLLPQRPTLVDLTAAAASCPLHCLCWCPDRPQ